MTENQSEQSKIAQLLARPQFGRVYLVNALNSGSDRVFLDALHNIIDAIADELEVDLIEDCPSTLLD